MSRVIRAFVFVLAIFVLGVLFAFQKNKNKLEDELQFHNSIQKSISFSSPVIGNDGLIPIEYTRRGENISPPLQWGNLPSGTKSLAITITDYDAPSPAFKLFVVGHWILYNIPVKIDSIEKGISAKKINELGITAGKNIEGKHEYTGPQPPFGIHEYYFRIYALDFGSLYLSKDDRDELTHALKNHVLGYGEFVGKF